MSLAKARLEMIAREQLEQVRGELAVAACLPTCRPFLAAPPGRATLGQPEAVEPPRAVAEGRLLRKGSDRLEANRHASQVARL